MIGNTIFVLDGGSGQADSAECVDLIQGLGNFGLPFCVSAISTLHGGGGWSMITHP